MRTRSQVVRRSFAVVAGIALAAGGVGVAGALQANATPDQTTRITSTDVAAKPSITIKSDKATAKVWTKVSFTGKTTGIAAKSVVQVQRLQSGKWVNFPATTKVTSKGTYSVWVQSGRVGVNKFRVVTAKATSTAVSINIVK
ncbi:hypothetical protein [Kribbella catacumbae]|uniref:hypothetical protein n=1 Tax=Kribbella catacumbae TaxID=460086 RepID=UPI000475F892|nr:hypothetical protein [Kribbella catacumbae]